MGARKRIEYGQYIVADPEIGHGQSTFKGTRILVFSDQPSAKKAKGKERLTPDTDNITFARR